MSKVSVLIPTRNERFLQETIDDIFNNSTGDIEVLVNLDGYWPDPPLREDERLVVIHQRRRGMRAGINTMAAVARGQYLMKCDAHCAFAPGFDEVLAAECADNWIVVPRRRSLDAEKWEPKAKEPIDAMRYFWPFAHPNDLGLHGKPWFERGRERRDITLDEELTFQGSLWFMHRSHWERVGPMQEDGYETFMGEPQELGFKTQLGPWEGKVMRNKRTWYAHLHKGRQWGRMYSMSNSERVRGNAYSFDLWWNDRWEGRAHDLEWLIDQWLPMPGWPDDWREYGRAD